MALNPGTRIGAYEIVALIGAGGMGEVYRARDPKLNRDVAIKVLLPDVTGDPDRLARFSREAQVLAALNHPNIAQIHGLEEANGVTALVLELVEGEDLAQRLTQGPIPLDEALPIARQIAEALEAAHDHGIIHRDLKPANIKVRPDGTVKVLDFGLAKAIDAGSGSGAPGSVEAMTSPTLSIHATRAGVILGTAAYMSPEQARGKAVGKRTDIWAFACVLFEMLTGARAFPGDDATDTIVAVVSKDPDWRALPAAVPSGIRNLLRRSLEKDPKRRLDSAAAVRIEIDDAGLNPPNPPNLRNPRSLRNLRVPWSMAAALAIALGLVWFNGRPQPPAPLYASIDAPADHVLGEDDAIAPLPTRTPMAFTRDGGLVIQAARAGKSQLFLRTLDRKDARPIAGTENARVPFISPDGTAVGFWSGGELRRVALEGGAPTTICPVKAAIGPLGAAWGTSDVIAFGDEASGRIMRVAAGGGTPVPVTAAPPSGRRHSAPNFLPDGRRILFSDVSTVDAGDSHLMVQAVDGGEARRVIASAVDGRVLPSGQMVFMRLGTLMIVPFDVARAEVTGDAVVVMGGVMQSGLRARAGAENTGAGMFAISSRGDLAFIPGPVLGPVAGRMIWMTLDGGSSSAEPAAGSPSGAPLFSRIAPDQSRAIVSVITSRRAEMWIADWKRDTWTACSGCNGNFGIGEWSPDGSRLLIGRTDTLVAHTPDGSVADQVLVQEPGRYIRPAKWLADGRVVYQSQVDEANAEIKLLERGGQAGRVLVPLGLSYGPVISPDGRWLAYSSAQTVGGETFVQPFPGPGPRTEITAGGGTNPLWSPDGRTIYYLRRSEQGGSVAMAVDVTMSPGLTAGRARELFRRPDSQRCIVTNCYDLSSDGKRFLMRDRDAAKRETVARMDLIMNWTATLPGSR